MKKERQDAEVSSIQGLSRRALMKGTAILAAGTAASALATSELIPSVGAQTTCRPYKARPTVITASPHKNIVETDRGKVYGYVKGGIVSCRGIPLRGVHKRKTTLFAAGQAQAVGRRTKHFVVGSGGSTAFYQHHRWASHRLEVRSRGLHV